ncbi:DUF3710 domain-containing protein [Microlunatus ginsengisoli]|uniref:DUF3710 domain-containing protein n=1 Tax=Microlunatus ginsengisoli TaxID=363863 RepID=A0ABP6ZNJ6_9ACTN
MIFRRRKNRDSDDVVEELDQESEESEESEDDAERADEGPDAEGVDDSEESDELDVDDLDGRDWRGAGPYDVAEVDLDEDPPEGLPRIDLGSIIVTGFPGAELRLQVDEATQAIVSAMLVHDDSALEIGAYAAPRSGGYWPELRQDLIEATTEAGGSVALTEGPFGVELRRIIPVTTPTGEEGYQPSRMWVVEGPRWLLRGIVYGQAALEEGVEPPVAQFLTAFRSVVVRRGDQAMGPGDLLALKLPEDLTPSE